MPDYTRKQRPNASSCNQRSSHRALQGYLALLFPDPPPNAWLVVSWLDTQRQWRSAWFRTHEIAAAGERILALSARRDVYIGLGLRHPHCRPGTGTRGTSDDVYAIGGLWIEFDHNGGVHAAKNLPTPDELLTFIEALPVRFSLLVDSTGGFHAYALLKELWRLDTPEEHQRASRLLRRFQRTIQAQAQASGFKIDSTADLARVLRPPGTSNHKSGTPRLVTVLHEDVIRYNPLDLEHAPWLAPMDDVSLPATGPDDFPPAQLDPIVNGCAWLRHCRDDAATLPEPEWYGMIGIVGRCIDGQDLAHLWSAPYPQYTQAETARKLQHALTDAGPRTCASIRHDLGGDAYCRGCPHWEQITSPIVLGLPPQPTLVVGTRRMIGHDPDRPYHKPLPGLRTTLRGLATTLRSL